MEILNNIWLALSTENEMLMKILMILFMPIEHYLTSSLFINLLRIETTNKKKLIYIFTISIESIITSFFTPTPFNVFINYVFIAILLKTLFNLSLLKIIIAILCPALIFILVETLIFNPYVTLLNITSEQASSIFIYRLPCVLIIYAAVFIINLLLSKRKTLKINFIENLDKKSKIIILLNFSLGLIVLCVQTFQNAYYSRTLPIFITILSFISILSYFFISIYSLTRVIKLYRTTKDLESAEEYNKSLSILHDSIKGFKHDFDNIVATLGGYIKTNDIEGLKKYYYELEDDCQKTNNLSTLNPMLINNPGIYSLLSSKYHKADEKNIKINLEYFVNLNDFKIKTYEFSRILGILLDNAIEASSECEEKIINICFRNEEKNHRHIVIIENTYKNKDVDTEEIFKNGISGKENHSGLGLWEIRQYMKKNNNLNLYTSKTDEYFKQQLEIYY